MLRGTDDILQNIPSSNLNDGLLFKMLPVPQTKFMDVNNVMSHNVIKPPDWSMWDLKYIIQQLLSTCMANFKFNIEYENYTQCGI